jgi:hypothetical protein
MREECAFEASGLSINPCQHARRAMVAVEVFAENFDCDPTKDPASLFSCPRVIRPIFPHPEFQGANRMWHSLVKQSPPGHRHGARIAENNRAFRFCVLPQAITSVPGVNVAHTPVSLDITQISKPQTRHSRVVISAAQPYIGAEEWTRMVFVLRWFSFSAEQ